MSSENVIKPDYLALREELMANTIASRLKLIILAETSDKRRFPNLESQTGVSESTWRTWWTRGGTPSGALIEGAGRAWPEFAFWLITGMTDIEFGHRMPELHICVHGYLDNWPEHQSTSEKAYATQYFKVCKELQELHKDSSLASDSEQLEILENTRQFVIRKRKYEICLSIDTTK